MIYKGDGLGVGLVGLLYGLFYGLFYGLGGGLGCWLINELGLRLGPNDDEEPKKAAPMRSRWVAYSTPNSSPFSNRSGSHTPDSIRAFRKR